MRRSLIVVLAAALALGAIGAPSAMAKKKKKKKPVPVTKTITFTQEGTITAPAPSSAASKGVTEAEFTAANNCASPPASQGFDGYVVELPADYRLGTATLEVLGSDATGEYDLDVYFYDSACSLMEPYMTDGADATGPIPGGAQWAVIDLFVGANASFKLTATTQITEIAS